MYILKDNFTFCISLFKIYILKAKKRLPDNNGLTIFFIQEVLMNLFYVKLDLTLLLDQTNIVVIHASLVGLWLDQSYSDKISKDRVSIKAKLPKFVTKIKARENNQNWPGGAIVNKGRNVISQDLWWVVFSCRTIFFSWNSVLFTNMGYTPRSSLSELKKIWNKKIGLKRRTVEKLCLNSRKRHSPFKQKFKVALFIGN